MSNAILYRLLGSFGPLARLDARRHYKSVSEPPHDKTNEMACAPRIIRVFAVRSVGSYGPKVS